MKFLPLLVARPTACLMVTGGVCLLGVVALSRLSPGLLPRSENPGITIVTRWHGVGAGRVERDITIPIERAIGDIAGIELLRGESSEGESRVSAVFAHHVDVSLRLLDASERLRRVRRDFPSDVEEPYVIRYDPDERPVFVVSFATSGSLERTRFLVESRLKPLFERVDGVSEVNVSGGMEREVQIVPLQLREGPALSALQSAVAAGSLNLGTGEQRGPSRTPALFQGRAGSAANIAELTLPIEKRAGARVRDFALVRDAERHPGNVVRTDGEERVSLFVQKGGDANALTVSKNCRKVIAAAKANGLDASVSYDQGLFIEEAVQRLASSAMYGIIAAGFVLFVFLRNALVTAITALCIPASVLATFFCMYVCHIDLNVMSLSGIALGVGMLVDNAVVMVDAVEQRIETGHAPRAAAALAVGATAPELAAATATTMVVFLPLAFVAPETRALFADLSLTIVISLGVSLLFAVAVLPAFLAACFEWGGAQTIGGQANLWRVHAPPVTIVSATIDRLNTAIGLLSGWIEALARSALAHRRATVTAGIAAMALLPLCYMATVKGSDSLSGERALSARIDLPTDTALEETKRLVAPVEAMLRTHAAVEETSVRIEKGHATVNARLRANAPDAQHLLPSLQARANSDPNVFVYFQGAQGREPEVDVILLGEEQAELQDFAREAAAQIRGRVPGVDQVLLRFRESGHDLVLVPARPRLLAAGIDMSELGHTLRTLLSGIVATKIYDGEREVDVRLIGRPEGAPTRSELENLIVPLTSGPAVLKDLVRLESDSAPRRLTRRNKRPSATLTVRFNGSEESIATELRRLLGSMAFPKNTTYMLGEELELRIQGRRELLIGVGAALFLVFAVLAGLFESVVRPFVILLTAPLTIGVVLLLFAILRLPLQMNVYLGLILLCGTVVNISILVVSSVPQSGSRRFGRATLVAIVQSRIRAILMTTLTTLIGLLPMLLAFGGGSELFRPLALTIGIGLIAGLPISLGFVPGLVSTIEGRLQLRRRKSRLSERKRSSRACSHDQE